MKLRWTIGLSTATAQKLKHCLPYAQNSSKFSLLQLQKDINHCDEQLAKVNVIICDVGYAYQRKLCQKEVY